MAFQPVRYFVLVCLSLTCSAFVATSRQYAHSIATKSADRFQESFLLKPRLQLRLQLYPEDRVRGLLERRLYWAEEYAFL